MAHAPVIFVSYISHGCPGVQGSRTSCRDSVQAIVIHCQGHMCTGSFRQSPRSHRRGVCGFPMSFPHIDVHTPL